MSGADDPGNVSLAKFQIHDDYTVRRVNVCVCVSSVCVYVLQPSLAHPSEPRQGCLGAQRLALTHSAWLDFNPSLAARGPHDTYMHAFFISFFLRVCVLFVSQRFRARARTRMFDDGCWGVDVCGTHFK